jgi:E3 ubiquitin-protein ligase MARCH6
LDLILLIVVMPSFMRSIRPAKLLYSWTTRFWKYMSVQLRLSSYFFGGRHPAEEVASTWAWLATFTQPWDLQLDEEPAVFDGEFRRVPSTDMVTFAPGVRLVVPVQEDGEPLDDVGRRTIEAQQAAAAKNHRDAEKDFMVVYIPPHFPLRMAVFAASLWILVSIAIAVVIAVPTLCGRAAFGLVQDGDVHDGYSYLVGFMLLWLCVVIGRSLDRMDKYRQRLANWTGLPPASPSLWFLKRSVRWAMKISYLVATLGVILPTLLGLVIEVYIVLPLRLTLNPTMPIHVRLVDIWMYGILYAKIIIGSRGRQVQTTISRGIARVRPFHLLLHSYRSSHSRSPRTAGPTPISSAQPQRSSSPSPAGLVSCSSSPPLSSACCNAGQTCQSLVVPYVCRFSVRTRHLLTIRAVLHVYPGIFCAAAVASSLPAVSAAFQSWTQHVRDKEFLLELRLQNREPEAKPKKRGYTIEFR